MSNRDISVAFRDFAEVEHVRDPPEHLYAEHVRDRVLAPIKERLSKAGIKAIRFVVESGDPAHVIVRFAEVKKADFSVMGSRGLSDLGGLVFGSVPHKVSHLAPCTCHRALT